MAIASVYQYFSNKEALTFALVGKMRTQYRDEITGFIETYQGDDVEELLHGLFKTTLVVFFKKKKFSRFVYSIEPLFFSHANIIAERELIMNALGKKLGEMGVQVSEDMDHVGKIIVAACGGYFRYLLYKPDDGEIDIHVQEMVKIGMGYLEHIKCEKSEA